MAQGISGLAVFYATAGGVLLWSGLKGATVKDTIKAVVSGNAANLQSLQNAQKVQGVTFSFTAPSSSSPDSASGSLQGIVNSGQSIPGVTVGIPAGVAAPAGTSSSGRSALLAAAKLYGWDTGSQWSSLVYVEMREAGFSPTARNGSSGALGLAQALGHGTSGTAGSLGNEYGGYGLSDAQAQAANSGNAYWQAVWMVNYIKSTYGTPAAAAAHESANNWY